MDQVSVIIDTETTGITKPSFSPLEEQPYVIDIGMLLVDEKGEIIDKLDSLIKPPVPLTEEREAMYSRNITNATLEGAPTFADLVPRIRQIGGAATLSIGHNITFDLDVVKYDGLRVGVEHFMLPRDIIDTVHEYRHLFGYNPNLEQLYKKIIGEDLQDHHRAFPDAMTVYQILKKVGFWA